MEKWKFSSQELQLWSKSFFLRGEFSFFSFTTIWSMQEKLRWTGYYPTINVSRSGLFLVIDSKNYSPEGSVQQKNPACLFVSLTGENQNDWCENSPFDEAFDDTVHIISSTRSFETCDLELMSAARDFIIPLIINPGKNILRDFVFTASSFILRHELMWNFHSN
jgi:hypothetical protein